MTILFESAPEGTTHFLRYASGHVAWCKAEAGENNQLILKEWDSYNQYWAPCIFAVEYYQSIGLMSIDDFPAKPESPAPGSAPVGATHYYSHGGEVSWYREVADNLYVWRDGSWYASTYKTALELSKACPLGAVSIFGEEKQSERAEDDPALTWLARNVPLEQVRGWLQKVGEGFNIIPSGMPPAILGQPMWFSAREVLARRAELQNKPSWEDHHDAKCFVQNSCGHWWKNTETGKVEPSEGYWRIHDSVVLKCVSTAWVELNKGELLGDWRDTLERRPADLSEPAVTERLDEATQSVLAAALNPMGERFKFEHNTKPVTVSNETVPLEQLVAVAGTGTGMPIAIERKAQEAEDLALKVAALLRENPGLFSANELADLHQLCDAELTKRDAAVCGGQKYVDAHWFERGELPPVGTECIFEPGDGECYFNERELKAKGQKVIIIAHAKYKKGCGSVAVFQWDLNDCCGVSSASQYGFRPIRTERDVLLSVIVEEMNHYDTDGKLADAILAAGFKLNGGTA